MGPGHGLQLRKNDLRLLLQGYYALETQLSENNEKAGKEAQGREKLVSNYQTLLNLAQSIQFEEHEREAHEELLKRISNLGAMLLCDTR